MIILLEKPLLSGYRSIPKKQFREAKSVGIKFLGLSGKKLLLPQTI
jgi:hypothetical protein